MNVHRLDADRIYLNTKSFGAAISHWRHIVDAANEMDSNLHKVFALMTELRGF